MSILVCHTEVTPLPNGRFLHYCPICKAPPESYPSSRIIRPCGPEAIQEIMGRARAEPIPRRGACKHRGERTEERDCPTCSGSVRVFVFTCPIKAACSVEKPLSGIACCAVCPSHEPISSAE
jgi:hypothetical protein